MGLEPRIVNEVRAESFRIWALMLVRTQTAAQIERIERVLENKFYDSGSSTGPFSAVAIFMALNVSGIIEANMDPEKVGARTQGPGPLEMLRASDEVPDRAKKEKQQETLAEIITKFEASNLPQFMSS